ncbi:MAG: pro-sigmaK processing inhibitor BofA family protein [Lawsonibacter sp.]
MAGAGAAPAGRAGPAPPPLGQLLRLAVRSSVGLAVLALFSQVSPLIGVSLGVNPINALVLGVLGAPGFGLLLMLQWALR